MATEPNPLPRAYAIVKDGQVAEFEALLAEHPGLLTGRPARADPMPGVLLLDWAIELDRLDMAAPLVAAGVDVNATTGQCDTILATAAGKASVATMRWLLDHGGDIDLKIEPTGSTPIWAAVAHGRLEMVEFLLDRGADPDILHGNPGRNAVATARLFGKEEVARFLEGRGLAANAIKPEEFDVETADFLAPGEPMSPSEWFEGRWYRVYEFACRRGFEALGAKNRVLFLVGYLIDQLLDGGAAMVYFNPSADYADRMPAALDAIGAARAARAVREINDLIPGGPAARVGDLGLGEFVEALPPPAAPPAAALESIFDEVDPATGERTLIAQLYDYYRA